jgi:hypothetical protein
MLLNRSSKKPSRHLSQQNMEVVVHDGETTDSNGEDLTKLFEPAFDPLPTVGETFTKEEGAAHTAVDAVIPTGDREIDEPRRAVAMANLLDVAWKCTHYHFGRQDPVIAIVAFDCLLLEQAGWIR